MTDVWNDRCIQCGGDLPLDAASNRLYCSPQCRETGFEVRMQELRQRYNAKRRRDRRATKSDRPCKECGALIPANAARGKIFCSVVCGDRDYARRRAAKRRVRKATKIDRPCKECGKLIQAKDDRRKFCSIECGHKDYARRRAAKRREGRNS
ncbi:MAG: hypothetical protein E6Q97_31740 [Desulfurellales bacterium]|nr:MAG: hypothetical protein E6Q97_31740 [Desulfurellales bacterium]